MDIQVGDRVTYKNGFVEIIHNSHIAQQDTDKDRIVKIERPKYEMIEEKKKILTDEEEEFLKSYIKFVESLNNGKVIAIYKQDTWLILTLKTGIEYQTEVGSKYKNIPDYSIDLKELGLEEN